MASERTVHTVSVGDGRTLEAVVAGSPEGPAVVFQHGTPSAAFAHPTLDREAAARGLRLVAPSRAGYGASTRDEGRDVAAAARDVARLLDGLGIVRYVTAGWSGGGPHALACAALDPQRCAAAISLAGVAPYLPHEFDFVAGMADDNVHEFELAVKGGPELVALLESAMTAMQRLTLSAHPRMHELFEGLVSPRDDACAEDDVRFLVESIDGAFAGGIGGWLDDDRAFVNRWGFDVAAIEVPVGIWFADHDLMVPTSHGEWLSAHVRGADRRRFPDDGHLSLGLEHYGELLDGLVELAGGSW